MEQIERIKQMELRMERAAKAVMELSAALEDYEAVQEDIAALNEYYGSEAAPFNLLLSRLDFGLLLHAVLHFTVIEL